MNRKNTISGDENDDPPLQPKQTPICDTTGDFPHSRHSVRIKRVRSAKGMVRELSSLSGGFFPFGKHPWDYSISNPYLANGATN